MMLRRLLALLISTVLILSWLSPYLPQPMRMEIKEAKAQTYQISLTQPDSNTYVLTSNTTKFIFKYESSSWVWKTIQIYNTTQEAWIDTANVITSDACILKNNTSGATKSTFIHTISVLQNTSSIVQIALQNQTLWNTYNLTVFEVFTARSSSKWIGLDFWVYTDKSISSWQLESRHWTIQFLNSAESKYLIDMSYGVAPNVGYAVDGAANLPLPMLYMDYKETAFALVADWSWYYNNTYCKIYTGERSFGVVREKYGGGWVGEPEKDNGFSIQSRNNQYISDKYLAFQGWFIWKPITTHTAAGFMETVEDIWWNENPYPPALASKDMYEPFDSQVGHLVDALMNHFDSTYGDWSRLETGSMDYIGACAGWNGMDALTLMAYGIYKQNQTVLNRAKAILDILIRTYQNTTLDRPYKAVWHNNPNVKKWGNHEPHGSIVGEQYFDPNVYETWQTGWATYAMLVGYKIFNNETYLMSAKRSLNWLVSVQQPEGWWYFVYDTSNLPTPYFVPYGGAQCGTGMAGFTLLYGYELTGNTTYKTAGLKAVNWTRDDWRKGWTFSTFTDEPHSTKPMDFLATFLPLVKAYEITGDTSYLNLTQTKIYSLLRWVGHIQLNGTNYSNAWNQPTSYTYSTLKMPTLGMVYNVYGWAMMQGEFEQYVLSYPYAIWQSPSSTVSLLRYLPAMKNGTSYGVAPWLEKYGQYYITEQTGHPWNLSGTWWVDAFGSCRPYYVALDILLYLMYEGYAYPTDGQILTQTLIPWYDPYRALHEAREIIVYNPTSVEKTFSLKIPNMFYPSVTITKNGTSLGTYNGGLISIPLTLPSKQWVKILVSQVPGKPFIRRLDAPANLKSLTYDTTTLEAIADSPPGTSVMEVNCTTKGQPLSVKVNGTSIPFTYDSTTKICSFNVTFPSVVRIEISWVETATIRGTVTDSITGKPIEGVNVTCDGASTMTATDGSYSITVAVGSYTLTFEKSGYYTNTTTVDCPAEGTYTVDVSLAPTQPPVNHELVIEDMDDGNKLYAMHKFYHFTAKAYDNDGDISTIKIAFTDGVTWANFSFTVSDRTFTRLDGYLIAELNVSDCSYEIGGGWVNATFSIRIKYRVDDAQDIELYQLSSDSLGNTTGWQTMQTDYADIIKPSVSVPSPLGTSLAMVGSLAGAVALWILWKKHGEKTNPR